MLNNGFTMLNNDSTLSSSLNVSSFEVDKNIMIRNSTTSGSRNYIQVGLGSGRS